MAAETPIIGVTLDWQDSIHGSFELQSVTSFQFSDGDSGETMFDVKQQPIGAKHGKGSSSISLSQVETVENAQKPNWRVLKRRQLTGLLTVTQIGANNAEGTRTAYTVKVSKVDSSNDNQGEATREIELTVIEENEQ